MWTKPLTYCRARVARRLAWVVVWPCVRVRLASKTAPMVDHTRLDRSGCTAATITTIITSALAQAGAASTNERRGQKDSRFSCRPMRRCRICVCPLFQRRNVNVTSLVFTGAYRCLTCARRPTPAAGSQASVEAESSAEDKEPRWRLFYNRSHALVPTYPLYLVVPTALSDADIR